MKAEQSYLRTARRLIRGVAETRLGWKAVEAAVVSDPAEQWFSGVKNWPDEISGFHDLAFLFTITGLNYGVISQRLDEAAHLYRVSSNLPDGVTLVEIGRFKGGSTFLIAAAMPNDAELHSYEIHAELPKGLTGEEVDRELEDALARYGLTDRVRLHVADSRTAPPTECELLFIDGDHSYEGVRADVEHWLPALRPGGHLLFHDAAPPTGYPEWRFSGVRRLVGELRRTDDLALERVAGSLVHFVRT